jgi:hypothetical protein
VLTAEILAAVRCGLVSISETADLTQEDRFLQIADCQNQLDSRPLQRHEPQARKVFPLCGKGAFVCGTIDARTPENHSSNLVARTTRPTHTSKCD